MTVMKLVIEDEAEKKAVENGGQPLLQVCSDTVRAFDVYCRNSGDPLLREGLVSWEYRACVGLLYQMYRGRIEAGYINQVGASAPSE